MKSVVLILINFGGVSDERRLGAGPKSPCKLGIRKVARDILSFTELTTPLCSMLGYVPLVTTYIFKVAIQIKKSRKHKKKNKEINAQQH